MTSVNTHFSRTLLSRPPCPVLEALARHIQYEVAVGLNGRVWVNADSPTKIILVANAISNSEFLNPAQTETLVAKLVEVGVTDLAWGVKPACSGSCAFSSSRLQPSPGGGLGGNGEHSLLCLLMWNAPGNLMHVCLLLLVVLQSLQISRL